MYVRQVTQQSHARSRILERRNALSSPIEQRLNGISAREFRGVEESKPALRRQATPRHSPAGRRITRPPAVEMHLEFGTRLSSTRNG